MGNYSNFSTHGYKIETPVGTNNSQGIVTYKATQIATNKPVLIKEFQFDRVSSDWSGYDALTSEKQILQQLNYHSIPKYLDYFETSSSFCLVCEYKHGTSLTNCFNFTLEETKAIALKLLEILIYLQLQPQPVVHRNIKPENILINNINGQLQVYLLDFGSATSIGHPGDDKPVRNMWLTPSEQTLNLGLNFTTDLYSLGAILVCMLTRTKSTDIGTLVGNNNRLNFKFLLPRLHPQLLQWLEKMTDPQPELRFRNAISAHSALNSIDLERTPLSVSVSKGKLAKYFTAATVVAGVFTAVNAIQHQFSNSTASNYSHPIPASGLSISCDRFTGLGNYHADFGEGGGSIRTASISCVDALDNCKLNVSNNPHSNMRCTWNDLVIFTAQNRSCAVLKKQFK